MGQCRYRYLLSGHRKELAEVRDQLADIEIQIDALLQTQADLAARRDQLEGLIAAGISPSSPPHEDIKDWDSEGKNDPRLLRLHLLLLAFDMELSERF